MLIVALDHQYPVRLYNQIHDLVDWYKIGNQLLYADGWVTLADRIKGDGHKLMIDAKLWDIPRTIRACMLQFTMADFITVRDDLQSLDAANENKLPHQTILSVGTLSSKFTGPLPRHYEHNGIVCPAYRVHLAQGTPKVVTGVRIDAPNNDHVKPITPQEAMEAGADYYVVGRPITQAKDPRKAVAVYV